MKKLALIILGLTLATPALADYQDYYGNWHRGGGWGGHHQYNNNCYNCYRGGDNGGAIIGGLVGGMILGGMLAQPHYQTYQPTCRKVYAGQFEVDGQLIDGYKTICN